MLVNIGGYRDYITVIDEAGTLKCFSRKIWQEHCQCIKYRKLTFRRTIVTESESGVNKSKDTRRNQNYKEETRRKWYVAA